MKPVIIISPFRAKTKRGNRENIAYAERLVDNAIAREEAPFAAHLLYPRVLDDNDAEARTRGMKAAWALYPVYAAGNGCAVVGVDRGMTAGMADDIEAAKRAGLPVHYRSLNVEVADGK